MDAVIREGYEQHLSPATPDVTADVPVHGLSLAEYVRCGNGRLTLRSARTGAAIDLKMRHSPTPKGMDLRVVVFWHVKQEWQVHLGQINMLLPRDGGWVWCPGELTYLQRKDNPDLVAAQAAVGLLVDGIRAGRLHSQLSVDAWSHCAECGRKLTDPDSIRRGYGPECYDKLMGGAR